MRFAGQAYEVWNKVAEREAKVRQGQHTCAEILKEKLLLLPIMLEDFGEDFLARIDGIDGKATRLGSGLKGVRRSLNLLFVIVPLNSGVGRASMLLGRFLRAFAGVVETIWNETA